MRLSVKTDTGYQLYEQQSGVVVGDNFLSRADFEEWFKDLLQFSDSDEFKLFASKLVECGSLIMKDHALEIGLKHFV